MTTQVTQKLSDKVISERRVAEFEKYEGKVIPVYVHRKSHLEGPIQMMYAGTKEGMHAWFISEKVEPALGDAYLRGVYAHLEWVIPREGNDSVILYDIYNNLPGTRVSTSSEGELERIVELWRNRTVHK